jgi:Tol biopolymer transport system component
MAYPGRHGYTIRGQGGSSALPLPELTTYARASWSPDGSRIAFEASKRKPSPSQPANRLYVVDTDLTDLHAVLPERPGAVTFGTSWSPDGRSLAFVAGRYTESGRLRFTISAVDVESGTVRALADAGTCITCSGPTPGVAWSPDGELIAYTEYRGLLHAVPADGGEPELLTTQPVIAPLAWQPVWPRASAQ